MRFTEIISESSGIRLKDIAKIATNMQDADFWLVRKGSDKTVGKPVKEFDPSRIGVKVVKTDVLDPNYLYYAMMNLHNQGHFARLANGTTNLVNIRVEDIANIPLGQQDVAEGTEQQLVTIYTNPAYKGATVDDSIKKSLPVTEAPFNKLQMWENSKSMKDPKVAQWVNNNLLPQLKQNGKLGPLVVWNNKGKLFVIDGNHRFIAYQAAGYNGNVPVQIVPDKMINVVDTVPGQQGVAEASSPAQQAAIAIHKKEEMDEGENWSKYNNKRVGGMSKKSVSSYRRSHPGSKIQTAVTTKPSKLKKGSKAAKRRKSFCARMKGMKKSRTSAKTARDPNSNINKSLRRWNCESIEQMEELLMLAEQMVAKARKEIL